MEPCIVRRMSGGNGREDVFAYADANDWKIDEPNKKGYLKMRCPCGQHLKWLHKTPSNPNYYRECLQWMKRCCNAD